MPKQHSARLKEKRVQAKKKSAGTQPKRIFKDYHTDEAKIFVIKFHKKSAILRINRLASLCTEGYARQKFYEQLIAYTIAPKLFPKPLGITHIVSEHLGGKKLWGVVTEIVKNRTPEYKTYQKEFYSQRHNKKGINHSSEGKAHIELTNSTMNTRHTMQRLGIYLPAEPVNMIGTKTGLVYIEFEVDPVRVEWALQKLPFVKRKKVKELLEKLKE